MNTNHNFQKELENNILNLNGITPKLLLHVCCAPCSSYVLEYLSNYFEITVLYYNPNISPEKEYRLRADEEKRLIGEMKFKNPVHYIEQQYNAKEYFNAVKGLETEPEGGKRCDVCFNLRLSKTAKLCKEQDFDCFTTTLTISPLKNAELLNEIGERVAKEYKTVWLPSDFKKKNGYKRSIQLSKEHGLYRQNYCGCIFSKKESEIKSK